MAKKERQPSQAGGGDGNIKEGDGRGRRKGRELKWD